MDKAKYIWMDGELTPWDDATVHVLSHTLHYGNGAIEGTKAYKTVDGRCAIFKLHEHTKRLLNSSKMTLMNVPFTLEELKEAQVKLLQENALFNGAYIRPLVYLGYGVMGLYHKDAPVKVSISSWEWGAYLGEEGLKKGIRLKISSFTRTPNTSGMGKAKAVANYLNSQMAKYEAVEAGYDEALLRDDQGYIAEASGAAFFIVRDGVLISPPSDNTLESITQQTIIDLAKDMGIEVLRRRVTREEVYIADEAFLTGTAAEVTPIREVDARIVGAGERGPMTELLQTAYFDVVAGKNPAYIHHLTYIN
ncbi:MAG TPA: branched-chain amino acid transaminase [Sulfurovum sp.]|jgi:branched-chain amino acid aminotransferase|nr:MAG: branched chain amino acid aminotransferase [Sulfurovum sp. 35-42-20]OYZ26263.1 MAG: branched chain amino acid aminotransferase [Sulfurovum sp. 16-42-52]OYZ48079.1 MAG: branched chain amino acid aminotransferase [Sulfurovum sp. 24-42-9]OZA46559.1 MAG: branched chain amino acid aminotransferase [Sulfurovum sp. 17-42-90]OZA60827.1 MAG: branched chain amino acid aminotransferase [Sulfurovum sp. 39-42-12]HQR74480.1 branched-chain amino acid transaminase [Sulfurovum sp.]